MEWASTGRALFAKNPNLRLLPPASDNKTCDSNGQFGHGPLNGDCNNMRDGGRSALDSSVFRFKPGETVTVETLALCCASEVSQWRCLLRFQNMLLVCEEKFVELMNRKIAAIGASDTKFYKCNRASLEKGS